jgi:glycerol-3-phosphate dehydrogenase
MAESVLKERPKCLSPQTLQHLLRNYGSEYRGILEYCDTNPQWSASISEDYPVIKAEVIHGVQREMAQKLADVVLRRTELGTAGHPGTACLYTCAEIMAEELGWDRNRVANEVQELEEVFRGTAED